MTQNQIAYLNYLENARSNKANEAIQNDKNKIARRELEIKDAASKRSTITGVLSAGIGALPKLLKLF